MKAGAMGVTFGRNASSTGPRPITKALKKIVIDKTSVEEAMEDAEPAPP